MPAIDTGRCKKIHRLISSVGGRALRDVLHVMFFQRYGFVCVSKPRLREAIPEARR
ncbi:hypothetical protein EMIT0P43_90103 [Pseudomonas jessenii]